MASLSCHTFRRTPPPPSPSSAHFWQLSWDCCSCHPFSSPSNEENHHWLIWEIMRVLPLLSSSSTGRWQLSWEVLPDSFLFKAVLRGTLKGPPHTTSWENSIPLNNFFLFTQLYDIREHIGVFLYICWNRPHNNALPFSTHTIFFYTNTRSNFDLYCSPPPLTPLILLTLTLTSNTRGMWTLLLFIFSPCNALQCWFKEIYVLHTLPWDKSQDNVKQNVIFTFWALLMPKGRTISNLWATYIWGIWNMEG